jgi:uncharacterized protein (DUF1778 family)
VRYNKPAMPSLIVRNPPGRNREGHYTRGPEEARDRIVAFRVSPTERHDLDDAAQSRGVTLSDLLREAALSTAAEDSLRRARRAR